MAERLWSEGKVEREAGARPPAFIKEMTSHGAGLPPLLQEGTGISTDPEKEKGHMIKSGSFGALSDRQGHAAAGRNSAADGAEQGQSDELQGESAAVDLDKPGGEEATAAMMPESPKWQSGLGLRKLARELGEKSSEQLENAKKMWDMLKSGQANGAGGGQGQEDTHTQNHQDQSGKSFEDGEARSRHGSGSADPRAGPPSPMKSPWSPVTRPMVDAFKEGVLKPGQVMGKRLAEVWDIHDLFDDGAEMLFPCDRMPRRMLASYLRQKRVPENDWQYTGTTTDAHAHMHTQALSLSLSLSLTHTHTHKLKIEWKKFFKIKVGSEGVRACIHLSG